MLIDLKSFLNSKVLFITFKTRLLFNSLLFYIFDDSNYSILYIMKKKNQNC